MRKINMKNGGLLNSNLIKIISRYPLGERRYLYIVKIDKETLLLGVTPQSVNYIKSLELDEDIVKNRNSEANGSFFNIFKEKLKEVKSVKK
jgi:flagellar biogenesis protein FliO